MQNGLLGGDPTSRQWSPSGRWHRLELSTDPSTADVVSRIGGVTDTISDVEAIWPSENLCIAKFADAEFGVLRQSAARWLDVRDVRDLQVSFPTSSKQPNIRTTAVPK